MELPELSPDEFTWERYESNYGSRLNLDFRSSINNVVMAREIRDRCLGYCDGSKLRIRPKSEKFWFHYPKFAFEKDVLDKWND